MDGKETQRDSDTYHGPAADLGFVPLQDLAQMRRPPRM